MGSKLAEVNCFFFFGFWMWGKEWLQCKENNSVLSFCVRVCTCTCACVWDGLSIHGYAACICIWDPWTMQSECIWGHTIGSRFCYSDIHDARNDTWNAMAVSQALNLLPCFVYHAFCEYHGREIMVQYTLKQSNLFLALWVPVTALYSVFAGLLLYSGIWIIPETPVMRYDYAPWRISHTPN